MEGATLAGEVAVHLGVHLAGAGGIPRVFGSESSPAGLTCLGPGAREPSVEAWSRSWGAPAGRRAACTAGRPP